MVTEGRGFSSQGGRRKPSLKREREDEEPTMGKWGESVLGGKSRRCKGPAWACAGRLLGPAAEVRQAAGAWRRLGHGGRMWVIFSAQREATEDYR